MAYTYTTYTNNIWHVQKPTQPYFAEITDNSKFSIRNHTRNHVNICAVARDLKFKGTLTPINLWHTTMWFILHHRQYIANTYLRSTLANNKNISYLYNNHFSETAWAALFELVIPRRQHQQQTKYTIRLIQKHVKQCIEKTRQKKLNFSHLTNIMYHAQKYSGSIQYEF